MARSARSPGRGARPGCRGPAGIAKNARELRGFSCAAGAASTAGLRNAYFVRPFPAPMSDLTTPQVVPPASPTPLPSDTGLFHAQRVAPTGAALAKLALGAL